LQNSQHDPTNVSGLKKDFFLMIGLLATTCRCNQNATNMRPPSIGRINLTGAA